MARIVTTIKKPDPSGDPRRVRIELSHKPIKPEDIPMAPVPETAGAEPVKPKGRRGKK